MNDNAILFDYANLAWRTAYMPCVGLRSPTPHTDQWHYYTFMSLYEYALEVAADTGLNFDVVLAVDSPDGYWRTALFPPYKQNRKTDEAAQAFESEFQLLRKRIADHLPWKVLEVPGCEADDVIAVLSQAYPGEVYIHSADIDYLMLTDDRVHVYDPMRRDYRVFPYIRGKEVYASAADYTDCAILTGQAGKDNVFNVKTPTDFSGSRRPGFGYVAARKLLDEAEGGSLKATLEKHGLLENWERNKALIDFAEIPSDIRERILQAWRSSPEKPRTDPAFFRHYSWGKRANEAEIVSVIDTILGASES